MSDDARDDRLPLIGLGSLVWCVSVIYLYELRTADEISLNSGKLQYRFLLSF